MQVLYLALILTIVLLIKVNKIENVNLIYILKTLINIGTQTAVSRPLTAKPKAA